VDPQAGVWVESTENECYSLGIPEEIDLSRLNKRITISEHLMQKLMQDGLDAGSDENFGDSFEREGRSAQQQQQQQSNNNARAYSPQRQSHFASPSSQQQPAQRPSSRGVSPSPAQRPSSRDYNRTGAGVTSQIQQMQGNIGGIVGANGMNNSASNLGQQQQFQSQPLHNRPSSQNNAAFEDDLQRLKKLRELSELQSLEEEEDRTKQKAPSVLDGIFEQRVCPESGE
jgi:hypothetical protein